MKGNGEEEGTRSDAFARVFQRVFLLLLGVLTLFLVAFALANVMFTGSQRASNVRDHAGALKTIATAEADFRANDRDGNRVQDFWTGDVSQLYGLKPTISGPGETIKLISLRLAGADDSPMKGGVAVSAEIGPEPATTTDVSAMTPSAPYSGHWFGTLTADFSDPDKPAYRTSTDRSGSETKNPSRFGFIAWPDPGKAGDGWVIIINESNTLYQRRALPHERAPLDPNARPPGPLPSPALSNWPSDRDRNLFWEKRE